MTDFPGWEVDRPHQSGPSQQGRGGGSPTALLGSQDFQHQRNENKSAFLFRESRSLKVVLFDLSL